MKSFAVFAAMVLLAVGCQAGWLRPGQPGFIIQTFTSYAPISGDNTGSITTNGSSYQFAGDNSGTVYIGGPGTQFRGKNDGALTVDGDGAFVMGSFAALSSVTNHGKGALILANLSAGQKAMVTDIGHGSLLIGAGTVSNAQAVVVGDGNVSHGARSVTADSFWGMGSGFYGNGAGLTNLRVSINALDTAITNLSYLYFSGPSNAVLSSSFGDLRWNAQVLATRAWTLAQGYGLLTLQDVIGHGAIASNSVTLGIDGPPAAQLNIRPVSSASAGLYVGAGSILSIQTDNNATNQLGAVGVNGAGFLKVVSGKLVFVAGSITNVLDADVGTP